MNHTRITSLSILVLAATLSLSPAAPLGTAFTYQGRLNDAGSPANGTYDLQFFLSTAGVGGNQIGNILTNDNVTTSNGLFTVELDFGGLFTNELVWLDIGVRPGASAGSFTQLSPRQKLTAVPQAQYASSAGSLVGLNPGQFLRSDTSATFTSGNLSFAGGTKILADVGSAVAPGYGFNGDSNTGIFGAGADTIAFTTAGAERVRINPAGTLVVNNGLLQLGVADGDQTIYFFETTATGESFKWSNASNRFELSDNLKVSGAISVDASSPGVNYAYNSFRGGAGDPVSSAMGNSGDVYVQNDLEVGVNAFLSKTLYMEGNLAAGQDGNQTIYFYNNGSRTGESFGWIEALDQFTLSDDLAIVGELEVGGVAGAAARIGAAPFFSLGLDTDVSMNFMIDRDASSTTAVFAWGHDGSTIGANRLADLSESGNLRVGGTVTANYAFDLAESFFKHEAVESGALVRIDPKRSDAVRLTTGESDALVIGVVSTQPGYLLGGAAFDLEALGKTWGQDVKARYLEEREQLKKEVLKSNAKLREKLEQPTQAGSDQKELAEARAELESGALELFHERNFAPIALSGRVPVNVDTRFGEIKAGDLLTPSPVPGVAMKASKPGPVIGTALEDFDKGSGKVLAFIHRGSYTPDARNAVRELEETVQEKSAKVAALQQQVRQLEDKVAGLQKMAAANQEQNSAWAARFAILEAMLAKAGITNEATESFASRRP